MKKLFIVFIYLITSSDISAQLNNNGGSIITTPGSVLYVDGNINNNSGSNITNEGTIEVSGDLNNNATINSNSTSSVINFFGNSDSDFSSTNSIVVRKIEINKRRANVNFLSSITVADTLDFQLGANTKIILGTADLTIDDEAIIRGASSSEYVVTSGTASLRKNINAPGSFEFPIGDSNNYSPVSSTVSGAMNTNAYVSIKVDETASPDLPTDATDYINRQWQVTASGISSYSNLLTGTYLPADINGNSSLIKGAAYHTNEWSYLDSDAGVNTVTSRVTTNNISFTGSNFYGRVDMKLFLEGAYSGGSMSTNLNIPLTSPYLDAPRSVSAIPSGVTDWIKLEIRDASNVNLVIDQYSAFIKSDGTIVGDDGLTLPMLKDASSTGYIAIYHRNHLPVRTPSILDFETTSPYDFSTGLSQAYNNPALSGDAMKDIDSGLFGLYRANANGDLTINIIDFITTKSNTATTQTGVYSPYDVNMDGTLNIIDFIQTKSSTAITRQAHL